MNDRARVTPVQNAATAAMATALLIAGCKVGPNYQPPVDTMPAHWVDVGPTAEVTPQVEPTMPAQSVPVAQEPLNLEQWWTLFNDPLLTNLIQRAQVANLDVLQAQARIRQARAARAIAAAGLWPSLNASSSATRSHANSSSFTESHSQFRAGFDAAWELDIFGGIQRGVEAAEANLQATIEDQRSVLVSLTAELASSYFDLRGAQQQLIIARQNLAAQQKSADLTRQRFEGGFVSRLDVVNADAQVASTSARIPSLITTIRQSMYAIAVLVAQEPGSLIAELGKETETIVLPTPPPEIPVGLPSDLLRRRPDIRAAESSLHAATANIGVAESDLFPRFSLTGSLGVQGNTLSALTAGSASVWSIGPSVTWPIFAGRQIRANIELQWAAAEETYRAYQQTVLTALQDVENSLIAYVQEQSRREALVRAVEANRQAVNLATQLYTVGNKDFLNVLQAQGALFAAEDALAQSQTQVITNLIALYKALGGGWEIGQADASVAAQ